MLKSGRSAMKFIQQTQLTEQIVLENATYLLSGFEQFSQSNSGEMDLQVQIQLRRFIHALPVPIQQPAQFQTMFMNLLQQQNNRALSYFNYLEYTQKFGSTDQFVGPLTSFLTKNVSILPQLVQTTRLWMTVNPDSKIDLIRKIIGDNPVLQNAFISVFIPQNFQNLYFEAFDGELGQIGHRIIKSELSEKPDQLTQEIKQIAERDFKDITYECCKTERHRHLLLEMIQNESGLQDYTAHYTKCYVLCQIIQACAKETVIEEYVFGKDELSIALDRLLSILINCELYNISMTYPLGGCTIQQCLQMDWFVTDEKSFIQMKKTKEMNGIQQLFVAGTIYNYTIRSVLISLLRTFENNMRVKNYLFQKLINLIPHNQNQLITYGTRCVITFFAIKYQYDILNYKLELANENKTDASDIIKNSQQMMSLMLQKDNQNLYIKMMNLFTSPLNNVDQSSNWLVTHHYVVYNENTIQQIYRRSWFGQAMIYEQNIFTKEKDQLTFIQSNLQINGTQFNKLINSQDKSLQTLLIHFQNDPQTERFFGYRVKIHNFYQVLMQDLVLPFTRGIQITLYLSDFLTNKLETENIAEYQMFCSNFITNLLTQSIQCQTSPCSIIQLIKKQLMIIKQNTDCLKQILLHLILLARVTAIINNDLGINSSQTIKFIVNELINISNIAAQQKLTQNIELLFLIQKFQYLYITNFGYIYEKELLIYQIWAILQNTNIDDQYNYNQESLPIIQTLCIACCSSFIQNGDNTSITVLVKALKQSFVCHQIDNTVQITQKQAELLSKQTRTLVHFVLGFPQYFSDEQFMQTLQQYVKNICFQALVPSEYTQLDVANNTIRNYINQAFNLSINIVISQQLQDHQSLQFFDAFIPIIDVAIQEYSLKSQQLSSQDNKDFLFLAKVLKYIIKPFDDKEISAFVKQMEIKQKQQHISHISQQYKLIAAGRDGNDLFLLYKSNIYVLYQRKVTQDLYFGYKLQEDAQDIKVLEELCVFERKCDDFEPLNTEFLYYYKEKQEAPKVFPLKFADQVVKEKLEQIISSIDYCARILEHRMIMDVYKE
ncbi:Conserved_hypothetical protein [Hexamita inflata]|uniref:Uncharacterized protein n=1 Tax=Hexamita inflata TaxID=28002 RepID=A0AA86Q5T6_9EUKA|nr:Conserved hypothetical protein [Hexamita inflata]